MITILKRRFTKVWLLLPVLAMLALPPAFAKTDISLDFLKSAFLYNFIKHTRWENDADIDQYLIGVLDDGQQKKFVNLINAKWSHLTIRDKPVKAILVPSYTEARKTQVLYVPKSFNDDLKRLNNDLSGSSTLIVTMQSLDKREVMINLMLLEEDNRLSFEINKSNMIYEKLEPQSSLVLLGGTELDIAKLYKQTKLQLDQQSDLLNLLEGKYKEQTDLILAQKEQLEEQRQEIISREFKLNTVEQQLVKQEKNLQLRESALKKVEQKLMLQETILQEGESTLQKQRHQLEKQLNQLDEQRQQLSSYSEEIDDKRQIIEDQSKTIKAQKEFSQKQTQTIEQQLSTLTEQTDLIEVQRERFYMVTGLLMIISLLSIYIAVSRRAIKKSKQFIEAQNIELENSSKKLKAASETKSRFLSTMSHEIRTPLNGVLGMVELLRDTPMSSGQKRYLDIIHSSGELLLNVINDVLDYSKIEAGKMDVEYLSTPIENFLIECASIFSVKASQKDFDFIIQTDPNLPQYMVLDPTRLKQVIVNLISNAFKFTESGHVLLKAFRDQHHLIISVSDTGEGMTEEQCSKIFQSFSQADSSVSRKHGGTGLGLAICKKIAELFGGSIHVKSQLNQGSTFWLELPLIEEPKSAEKSSLFSHIKSHTLVAFRVHPMLISNLKAHTESYGIDLLYIEEIADLESYFHRLKGKDSGRILIDDFTFAYTENEDLEKLRDFEYNMVVYVTEESSLFCKDSDFKTSQFLSLTKPISPYVLLSLTEKYLIHPHDDPVHREDKNSHKDTNFEFLKVMVAEDNKVNQLVIKSILKKFGIEPVLTCNGLEAVEAVKSKMDSPDRFDLIFMDCEMPHMDGYTATQKIRELEGDTKYKMTIVALTAHAMEEYRQKALEAGMDDHLCKPIKLEDIQRVLENLSVIEIPLTLPYLTQDDKKSQNE